MKVFVGNEAYVIDRNVKNIQNEISEPSMNVTSFTDDYDMSVVESVACMAPVFSDKRLLLFHLNELKGGDDFKTFLKKVPSSTEVVICATKVDKRSSFYKTYKDCIKVCDKLSEEQCLHLICRIADKEGRKVEKVAALELLARLHYFEVDSVNFYSVIGAVKQICVLSDLTMAAVQQELPENMVGKAYSLATYLCNHQTKALFSLVHYLVANGENEIGLLSILARVFRFAWKDKVVGTQEIPKFQYQVVLGYSDKVLSEAQDICTDAIRQIKESGMGDIVLSVTLVKLLQLL